MALVDSAPFASYSSKVDAHVPTFTTFDQTSPVLHPRESPAIASAMYGQGPKPVGSRYEVVPHTGPGVAVYCRQPSQSVLSKGNGLFASPNRPFYYPDPEGKPFIDVDGNTCGKRWIMIDPKGGEEEKGGCVVM